MRRSRSTVPITVSSPIGILMGFRAADPRLSALRRGAKVRVA